MQFHGQKQVHGRPRRLWSVTGFAVLVLAVIAVFALPVTFVGPAGTAVASNPGGNGRLVYSALVESKTHPGEWSPEIFTMNPDGSDVRRLTFDAGEEPWVEIGNEEWSLSMNHSAAWSPRGDMIAYVHLSAVEAIRLIDPEGVPLGTVTEAFVNVGSLSWSPDGQQLAFYGVAPADSGGRAGLWVIRVDGTEPRLLIDEDAAPVIFVSGPEWSPDGDSIAFSAYSADPTEEGGRSIYLADTDGSDVRWVECGGWITVGDRTRRADSFFPEWAPDGGALYCSSGQPDFPPDSVDIWVTSMSDGSTQELTTLSGDEEYPTASPDGTTLLLTADEGGTRGLWSYDPLVRIGDFTGFGLDWQPLQGSFWDDEASIFAADIEWMAQQGITRGCNPPRNDRYCPKANVTRGQMAAFLVRALDLTDRLDDRFIDDDDSIFEADIEKLAAAGITRGCNPPRNDRYCPTATVTRGQMAAFLVRALGYTDNGGGDLFVDDDDSIFEHDIDRLGAAGVTRGCNPPASDRFCPRGYVTRGQMAAFLHRALG